MHHTLTHSTSETVAQVYSKPALRLVSYFSRELTGEKCIGTDERIQIEIGMGFAPCTTALWHKSQSA